MSFVRAFRCAAVIALAAVGLAGCASAAPAPRSSATPTSTPTPVAPAADPTATPVPDPLLVISGTVTDQEGQSLSIVMTTTSVRPPSDQDRADYAASRCAGDPNVDPFGGEDTRVVTFGVESVASSGFTGWTDARGVRVSGNLFEGPIWEPEQHGEGAQCYTDSVVVRPGSGEARMITSSNAWNIPSPLAGDGSITLAHYGLDAQVVDALGQPTGLSTLTGCSAVASADLDALALGVLPGGWGATQVLPSYCHYGRTPY